MSDLVERAEAAANGLDSLMATYFLNAPSSAEALIIRELLAELTRLRSLNAELAEALKGCSHPIRWEPIKGASLEEIKANARESETYRHGDTLIVLVNEGDYLMHPIATASAKEALARANGGGHVREP
jgi:hypothetical protein